MLRHLLASTAALAVVWSATIGFAASLRLHPVALSATSHVVASCDPDGITIAPHLAWQGRVVVDRIGVNGIADRCVGLRLTAVLTGQAGPVELAPAPIVASSRDDNRLLIQLPTGVSAVGLERIHVAIS